MELQGAVHHISDEQQVSASYTKRELVIKTDEQYPQFINIEFSQGKCNLELDALTHGTVVKVHINIGGREWVNPQDTSKKSWVKSVFGGYKFAVPSDRISELKHNPEKHIKGINASAANETPTQNGVVVEQPSW